jgi:pimeloyl-ACP methyl ester carboxylesterase
VTGGERKEARRRLVPRGLRLATLALLVALLVLVGTGWSYLDAQARAVAVLSSVMEIPILGSAVEVATGEPRLEDTAVAGNPALVARPAGAGPWPALFLVNGTVPEGRELPEIRRLAEGLARAGYLVVVPDLPGLREDAITPETAAETAAVALSLSEWREARGEKVSLVGVSTGATLALLAAGEDDLEGRVALVAGVAPYADIRTVLCVATTGHYERDGRMVRYAAEPFLSYVSARSLISALPPGADRERLLAELDRVDRLDPDPLAGLRDLAADEAQRHSPEALSVVELLANEDPGRFDELYAGLPAGVREDLEELSPVAQENEIEAPVELVSGPRDRYFPLTESYEILRFAPKGRLTVTGALDHAELTFSPERIREFWKMNLFVVRALSEARDESKLG